MSYTAVAAALALEDDLPAGERQAAFSLASFANPEHRSRPGTPVAATRAGLSRSQYLAARDSLERRGLVVVEDPGGGRGNAPTVALVFAQTGPWIEGEINAPLFETVLSYSRTRGSARLLLAALAALAGDDLAVTGISTEELRAAAGMADSTYRRARTSLLSSGEAVVDVEGGGRGRTNSWLLTDPRCGNPQPLRAPRARVAPGAAARPLMAPAKAPAVTDADETAPAAAAGGHGNRPGLSGVSTVNPGQDRTVSGRKGPGLSGVSGVNPGQGRTVSRPETPPQTPPETPPETPPPNARTGREPQNPRTAPPTPRPGGSGAGTVTIVEDYVTERGRTRQRPVVVELDAIRQQLPHPGEVDVADWQQIRSELRRIVGESTFEIWLAQLELIATDPDRRLLLTSPAATRAWVVKRFGRALDRAAGPVGRELRLASDRELALLRALNATTPNVGVGAGAGDTPAAGRLPDLIHNDHKEAV
jgi:hypothetical protein